MLNTVMLKNSRSACFDWHNFIWTDISYEILLHILLFGLTLFSKSLEFDLLIQKAFEQLL